VAARLRWAARAAGQGDARGPGQAGRGALGHGRRARSREGWPALGGLAGGKGRKGFSLFSIFLISFAIVYLGFGL
jgi:hypothetical protein